jgi:hypothetical protein
MTKGNDPADRLDKLDALNSEGHIHRADTVPPPNSGDAYSAETVVREAPPEVLAAIRERRKEQAAAEKPQPLGKQGLSSSLHRRPSLGSISRKKCRRPAGTRRPQSRMPRRGHTFRRSAYPASRRPGEERGTSRTTQ